MSAFLKLAGERQIWLRVAACAECMNRNAHLLSLLLPVVPLERACKRLRRIRGYRRSARARLRLEYFTCPRLVFHQRAQVGKYNVAGDRGESERGGCYARRRAHNGYERSFAAFGVLLVLALTAFYGLTGSNAALRRCCAWAAPSPDSARRPRPFINTVLTPV